MFATNISPSFILEYISSDVRVILATCTVVKQLINGKLTFYFYHKIYIFKYSLQGQRFYIQMQENINQRYAQINQENKLRCPIVLLRHLHWHWYWQKHFYRHPRKDQTEQKVPFWLLPICLNKKSRLDGSRLELLEKQI